jgi:hypothetical protein
MEMGKGRRWGATIFGGEEGGGGEAVPRCRRRTTQRRAMRLGRSKVAADVWGSKMTKRNWVGGLNT